MFIVNITHLNQDFMPTFGHWTGRKDKKNLRQDSRAESNNLSTCIVSKIIIQLYLTYVFSISNTIGKQLLAWFKALNYTSWRKKGHKQNKKKVKKLTAVILASSSSPEESSEAFLLLLLLSDILFYLFFFGFVFFLYNNQFDLFTPTTFHWK